MSDVIGDAVSRMARDRAKQLDDYVRPLIDAGVNPKDWVLEQYPMEWHTGDRNSLSRFAVMRVTQKVRLRPKTTDEKVWDWMREFDEAVEYGRA